MFPRFERIAAVLVCLALCTCAGARPVSRGDPRVLGLRADLANRFVPAGSGASVLARLRVDISSLGNVHRPPINLALVVDTSGSMEGQAIADARAASLAVVDALADGDVVSVTVFHSTAEVLVPATRLDRTSRANARSRLQAMSAHGTTDMTDGLRLGYIEAMRFFRRDGVNRIVLLSDGVPNDTTQLMSMASGAGAHGVAITALGLGPDYNETLMASMARESGGRFHYIAQSSEVATVFRDEVLRLQRVLARNASIVMTPGPGVHIDSVVGQNVSAVDGSSVRVALGDVTEGEPRDLIVHMTAPGHRAGASVELMDAVLVFDDALQHAGRLERRVFVGARATASDSELTSGRNPDVERTAARIEAAASTVEAVRLARQGDIATAAAALDSAARRAREMGNEYNDRELQAQASSIDSLRTALPSVAPAAAMPSPAAPVRAGALEPASVVRREHDRAVQMQEGY